MNWIILIIAGLFETGFAFCLGKAKETTGNEMHYGMLVLLLPEYQHGLLIIKRPRLYRSEQLMLYGQELERLGLF